MRFRRATHELLVDGQATARGSYEALIAQAESLKLGEYERWGIWKLIGGRRYGAPDAFGFAAGTTSTADLARMGVPIAPGLVSDERKL